MNIDEIIGRSLGNESLEEKSVHFRITIDAVKSRTRRIQSIRIFFIEEVFLFQFMSKTLQ